MEREMTPHKPTIAFYYPWASFQDGWLKLALLTWDNIAPIRPSGIGDHDGDLVRPIRDEDTDLVRQVRDETDLIVDITPSTNDL
jgi:hypothetical protein